MCAAGVAAADTRCVQEFLAKTAFNPGPVDGLWGRKTAGALQEFLEQVVRDDSYPADRSATGEICELITGPRREELLEAAWLRDYGITLDPDSYVAASPTEFDFSGIDVDTDYSGQCRFEIWRILVTDNDRSETVAYGTVAIESGTLRFGERSHHWEVGGLADSTYLASDANLKIDRTGKIFGKAPFFTHFVGPGETARPPMYVEYSIRHEPEGEYPGGLNWFSSESWQRNYFRLMC